MLLVNKVKLAVMMPAMAFAAGACMARVDAYDIALGKYDSLLKSHVRSGLVDYEALKRNPRPLKQVLAGFAGVSEKRFNGWDEQTRIAFLINLYNAATLRMIVEHYPLKSIKDIGSWRKGPWEQPVVTLFGKTITLNNLEHDVLRKNYHEPRIHMALVCAARGCPPLRSEAYTAEKLNDQLNDQSHTYLATAAGLKIDRKKGVAYISSIFKWYGKDFDSVTAFIERHSGKKISGLKIKYLRYDWSLNDK